jgi:branched-chain amino acid transport system substrate-binding protein
MEINFNASQLRRRTLIQAAASLAVAPYAVAHAAVQAKKPVNGDILVGQTAALTGVLSAANVDVNRGIRAHLAEINAKGGVGGRKINFVSIDDGYDPERAKANFKELVDVRGAFALLSVGGTPANMALGPLIAEAKIPHIGPISGADALRTPTNPYIFYTHATYGGEMARLAEQLSTIGQMKVLVIHSDNAFGKGATAGFTQLGKAKGLEITTLMIGDTPADLEKSLPTLLAAEPNAVVSFYASPSNNGVDSIKQFRAKNQGTPLYTLSLLANPSTLQQMGAAAANMTVSQVVPFPYRSATLVLVRNYQAAMRANKEENFSHNSLEGYINAKLLVHGLKGAGGNLTRQRFMAALETNIELDGYNLNFKGGNRNGSNYTDLVIANAKGGFLK